MGYRMLGRLHAALVAERGQGTVEYVGLILLIAMVIGTVLTVGKGLKDGGIAETVVTTLSHAIGGVGGK